MAPKDTLANFRGVSSAIFELTRLFPALSTFKTLQAINRQLLDGKNEANTISSQI